MLFLWHLPPIGVRRIGFYGLYKTRNRPRLSATSRRRSCANRPRNSSPAPIAPSLTPLPASPSPPPSSPSFSHTPRCLTPSYPPYYYQKTAFFVSVVGVVEIGGLIDLNFDRKPRTDARMQQRVVKIRGGINIEEKNFLGKWWRFLVELFFKLVLYVFDMLFLGELEAGIASLIRWF